MLYKITSICTIVNVFPNILLYTKTDMFVLYIVR